MSEAGDVPPVREDGPIVPRLARPSVDLRVDDVQSAVRDSERERAVVFDIDDVSIAYGARPAITNVSMQIRQHHVTAFIGPSGCGKTTLLRALNRMNDLIPSASMTGQIRYHGFDLNDGSVDPVEVRRRIGMVFQRPNPFHKSIYENVAFGP